MGDMLTLTDVTSPIPEIAAEASLIEALRLLRRAKRHMAVVRDPGGKQLGVVTLEDLLSAVVGQLPTEPMLPQEPGSAGDART
jgi:CBS domain containing-hemolysin-like protein